MDTPSPFWRPVDLAHTALLLTDVQDQILSRMPLDTRTTYLNNVKAVLDHFRTQITVRRAQKARSDSSSPDQNPMAPNDGIPLIIHHLIPVGLNSHAWVSPYNKLNAAWSARTLGSLVQHVPGATDPETPWFAVPKALKPPPPRPASSGPSGTGSGWNVDEVVLGKTRVGSFSDSVLLGYLRARDVRHVVLCGLTTEGAVLSSVRGGADLDFHVVIVREGCWSAEEEEGVHGFVLGRLVGRFADVVGVGDVLGLI